MEMRESWERAERVCFDKLLSHLGDKENERGFLGYLPERAVDVWVFSSGGNVESELDRFWGSANVSEVGYSVLRMPAYAACAFNRRADALRWGMQVMEWLKLTRNMNGLENVAHCRPVGMPSEPQPEYLDKLVLWSVRVDMELMFLTEKA